MKKINLNLIVIISTLLWSCTSVPATVDNTAPAWYKNEVIYNLEIKTFKDSDGDGLGDIRGLTGKLSYLDSLGVTMIWLAPFQPSPWQDDGYDVSDYYRVDPRLGTMNDLQALLTAAKVRRIKVIMDLVLNHTSTSHPWFRERKDWYLWTWKRPKDWDKGMGFPVVEKETWRKDSTFGGYYFHRFYRFEPDLNYQNPEVVAEAKKIMSFWLQKGMDGFRLDAVPFIIDDPRESAEHPAHDFKLFKELTGHVAKVKPGALLLGEANVKPEEAGDYFAGNHRGLDMMLNFDVNEYLFYALASGDAKPLKKALKATANKPTADQWAHFLRNHDEIDLGKLNKKQLEKVYQKMGPDSNMQLYDRGIRRRLAPMLNNDHRRLQQAYSLLLALPGTPILRYGEEIGMGDDLNLQERLSVRTPMQWDSGRQAGFTVSKKIVRPVINDPEYGYRQVNVARQRRDSLSLYNFIRRLIALRKGHPVIGQGTWDLLAGDADNVISILYRNNNEKLLVSFNFSEQPVKMKYHFPEKTKAVELVSGKTGLDSEIEAFGSRWYRLDSR